MQTPTPREPPPCDSSWTIGADWTAPAQIAQAILVLAAAGEPVPVSLLDRLADGVLAAPLPALALQVREGGEHRLGRAIDLAEQVLRAGRTVEKGSEREAG